MNNYFKNKDKSTEPGSLERSFYSNPDKKRLTLLGFEKLLDRDHFLDDWKLHGLGEDECHEYNKRTYVADVIDPSLLIVHFGNLLPPDDPGFAQLLYNLLETWKNAAGFDMSHHIPGEGVHVLAAVDATMYPEDATRVARLEAAYEKVAEELQASKAFCPDEDPNDYEGNAAGTVPATPVVDLVAQMLATVDIGKDEDLKIRRHIYLRGVIMEVSPGFDKHSAHYRIFLYDKGIVRDFAVNNIAPLPMKYYKVIPPQYRLVKTPGMRPLNIKRITIDLITRKKADIEIRLKNWPDSSLRLAKRLLMAPSSYISIDVLGDHGLFIFGDIKFQTVDSTENNGLSHIQQARLGRSYESYFQGKNIAYSDDKAYYKDLAVDAEDENLSNWKEEAKALAWNSCGGRPYNMPF